MVDEVTGVSQEVLQMQREAEQRVRRMREENRRLARQMEACPPEKRTVSPPPRRDGGRFLPLLLTLVILREGGPIELLLALLYLCL